MGSSGYERAKRGNAPRIPYGVLLVPCFLYRRLLFLVSGSENSSFRFVSSNVCVKNCFEKGDEIAFPLLLLLLFPSLYLEAHLHFCPPYDDTRIEANNGEKIRLLGPESFGNFHRKSFSGRRTGRERESWVTDGKTMRKVVVGER